MDGLTEAGLTRRGLLARLGVAGAGMVLGGALARPAFAHALLETKTSTLRVALGASMSTLDVAFFNSGSANFIGGLVNEPLITLSSKGELVPWLASSYKAVSPTHYEFTLREGVKFSDGSPLTIEDVVYSFARNLPHSGLKSQLGAAYYSNVKTIRRTGRNTMTVLLKKPDVTFLYLAPIYTLIVKKSFTKPLGQHYARPGGKMLGTGPFVLTHFDSTRISFARSPHYWRHRPAVSAVDFQVIADPQAQQLAVRSGNIDVVYGVTSSDVAEYTKISGVSVAGSVGVSYYLAFDVTTPPWNDVHVRRAFAHCWDGPGFVKGPMHGRAQVSNGMVFPWQWRTVMTEKQIKAFFKSLPKYRFDVAAAKAELAKSASPNGFSTSILYPSGAPAIGLALQTLAANLQQIGVKLEVKETTNTAYWSSVTANKGGGVSIVNFTSDYDDPNDFLSICYDSAYAAPNAWNLAHYKNSQVDRLLRVEQGTTNKAARAKAMQKIYRISARDLPYLGLWYDELAAVARHPFRVKAFSPIYYLTQWVDEIAA
ncbi:MAG TPA: ABC transporter substrate-binding protein [Gaiellaceae bacterium]|nr:ABC transporter substrate-binding protein [Gaiellaceae bacterium]